VTTIALNEWIAEQGLPEGSLLFEVQDSVGRPRAVFDLAWPAGLQAGLSPPVAVLLGEGQELLEVANDLGYRCFTSVDDFKRYVRREVVGDAEADEAPVAATA
jgi:hypothetical protein